MEHESSHFIREIIRADIAAGKHKQVTTRFPPEPNGYLHIGHAKAICVDFGMATEFNGQCHLRFDDTNPAKEDIEYENAIAHDIQWLGFDWQGNLFHASDYFERLYLYAEALIAKGLAFVCDLTDAEIRVGRGTVTEAGNHSPYRDRTVDENLNLFRKMRDGAFDEGHCVLRAKIDMSSVNMKMRDPLLYRIRKVVHHRTGDTWQIYPFYDFAHCLSDSIEGITHSFCSLEFDNNRELYNWILDNLDVPKPQPRQYEFARLKLGYTVMSKRRLLQLVESGRVSGWDDPRMPTLAGLRRRGVRPEAIRAFIERVGVSKADSLVDIALLEHAIRTDLNHEAKRVMAVVHPLRVIVESWHEEKVDTIDADYWPHDVPKEGTRKVSFTRELYIERDDFSLDPPKKFRRLAIGREVRLRYGYWIKCVDVDKDESGNVVAIRCTHDPSTRAGHDPVDGRTVKGTIHWVSAKTAVPARFAVYDRLFSIERPDGSDFVQQLNPDSLTLHHGFVEASVADDDADTRYQFERQGYYWRDSESTPEALKFNRIVPLKDSWARSQSTAPVLPARTKKEVPQQNSARVLDPVHQAATDKLVADLGISLGDAVVLAEDIELQNYFHAVCVRHNDNTRSARWVVNELGRFRDGQPLSNLPFDVVDFAGLLDLLGDDTLNPRLAKQVLEIMAKDGGGAFEIAEANGWKQIKDTGALQGIIQGVIDANTEKAAGVKENPRLIGFFVGQVMKATGGKAPGKVVKEILSAKLLG